jgi:HSP20 family protein
MTDVLPEKKRESVPARWTPFEDLETVVDRMREMLDQTFSGFSRWPAARYADMWTPPVDIEETDDAYLLEAELPGVDRNDVDVELVGNELTITGEIKEKERKGVVRRQARRTGRFEYWVTLPRQVEPEDVDAALSDGILRVRMPKSERADRRKIELKAS